MCRPKSCEDIVCFRQKSSFGNQLFDVYNEGFQNKKKKVFMCKKHWNVMQAREGTSFSFRRDVQEYQDGFLDASSNNYWIGLKTLHSITNSTHSKYRLKIRLDGIGSTFAEYNMNGFKIGSYPDFMISFHKSNVSVESDTLTKAVREDVFSLLGNPFTVNYIFPSDELHSPCKHSISGGWWTFRRKQKGPHPCYVIMLNGNMYNNKEKRREKTISLRNKMYALSSSMIFHDASYNCNNPCKNGATCEYDAIDNNSICICVEGYCGDHCEFENTCWQTTCFTDPSNANRPTCDCPSGRCGQSCDIPCHFYPHIGYIIFNGVVILVCIITIKMTVKMKYDILLPPPSNRKSRIVRKGMYKSRVDKLMEKQSPGYLEKENRDQIRKYEDVTALPCDEELAHMIGIMQTNLLSDYVQNSAKALGNTANTAIKDSRKQELFHKMAQIRNSIKSSNAFLGGDKPNASCEGDKSRVNNKPLVGKMESSRVENDIEKEEDDEDSSLFNSYDDIFKSDDTIVSYNIKSRRIFCCTIL